MKPMAHLIRDTEAASQLGVPIREVLEMIDSGELRAYQRGERVWVRDDEIRMRQQASDQR